MSYVILGNSITAANAGLNTGAFATPAANSTFTPNFQVPSGKLLYVTSLSLQVSEIVAANNARLDFGYNTANSNAPATFTILIPGSAGGDTELPFDFPLIVPQNAWPQFQYNLLVANGTQILVALIGYVE